MRLDKFLSHMGLGSRKEVKTFLKKEKIEINGIQIKDGKVSVDENNDIVTLNGEVLYYESEFYYLLHKPQGVISATEDRQHRTVLDLLKAEDYREDLFPVGRLDKDTTGLLLITNDGKLSHELLSPKKHVSKRYYATISGIVTAEDKRVFSEGMLISGGEKCLPGHLEIEGIDLDLNQSYVRVTISEGKYHQVKRMFEALGKQVLTLHRETMGPLVLEEALKIGTYRKLTEKELLKLKTYRRA
ncbi:pseudouridine synthase [Vagococcus intermedius]|uniref:Pseudouridine synthase n=1 Tax=Vagococcus intermedius TaxID=2991418 RepID=A0AAF0CUS5_9ENTE|nr:pseudouridine synthase [Vagococcus intermedius]WEG73249.1 rRNA pseudouridine synthase [Vagococcus intermedius]WEG75334.1 rRNA pseudouridine synthase [Vagococcus intermedius]